MSFRSHVIERALRALLISWMPVAVMMLTAGVAAARERPHIPVWTPEGYRVIDQASRGVVGIDRTGPWIPTDASVVVIQGRRVTIWDPDLRRAASTLELSGGDETLGRLVGTAQIAGGKIYFVVESPTRLIEVDLEAGTRRVVFRLDRFHPVGGARLTVSPDGRFVAITASRGLDSIGKSSASRTDTTIVRLRDGEEVRLGSRRGRPTFTANGRFVGFSGTAVEVYDVSDLFGGSRELRRFDVPQAERGIRSLVPRGENSKLLGFSFEGVCEIDAASGVVRWGDIDLDLIGREPIQRIGDRLFVPSTPAETLREFAIDLPSKTSALVHVRSWSLPERSRPFPRRGRLRTVVCPSADRVYYADWNGLSVRTLGDEEPTPNSWEQFSSALTEHRLWWSGDGKIHAGQLVYDLETRTVEKVHQKMHRRRRDRLVYHLPRTARFEWFVTSQEQKTVLAVIDRVTRRSTVTTIEDRVGTRPTVSADGGWLLFEWSQRKHEPESPVVSVQKAFELFDVTTSKHIRSFSASFATVGRNGVVFETNDVEGEGLMTRAVDVSGSVLWKAAGRFLAVSSDGRFIATDRGLYGQEGEKLHDLVEASELVVRAKFSPNSESLYLNVQLEDGSRRLRFHETAAPAKVEEIEAARHIHALDGRYERKFERHSPDGRFWIQKIGSDSYPTFRLLERTLRKD